MLFRSPQLDEAKAIARIVELRGTVDRDFPEGPVVTIQFGAEGRFREVSAALLQSFPKLRSLQLADASITIADLKKIATLTELRKLDLDRTSVTDAGLAELKPLQKLTHLRLFATDITDAGLKEIKELKSLTALRAGKTQITDAGLAELKELSRLQILGFAETEITDASLPVLKGLPRLVEINIRGTRLTAAGVAELASTFPNANVTGAPRRMVSPVQQASTVVPFEQLTVTPTPRINWLGWLLLVHGALALLLLEYFGWNWIAQQSVVGDHLPEPGWKRFAVQRTLSLTLLLAIAVLFLYFFG